MLMRYLAIVLTFSLALLVSCKKDNKTNPTPVRAKPLTDFALIPVKDAEWNIHTQGIATKEGKVDTSHHTYTTITTTGVDTLVNGLRFFRYRVEHRIEYPSNPPQVPSTVFNLYVREDTAARTVFLAKPDFQEWVVVGFQDVEVGTIVNEKPEIAIKYVDSMIMEGQYLKRWVACNTYDRSLEYFYKGYGMCTQTGIALRSMIVPTGGQVMSTEFRYKNSKQKFVNGVVF